MTEPIEDRAQRAFRDAFATRGDEAPKEPLAVPGGPRRRSWWIAGAAAAVVGAVAVPTAILRGDDTAPDPAPATTSATDDPAGTRWISYRGIEVAVPEDWGYDYGPGRPDCIRAEDMRDGAWPREAPSAPYVEIEGSGRGVTLQGCFPDPSIRGPEAFGDLPFELWQPHVSFEPATRHVAEDGEWIYRGWTLTRRTIEQAQITVLAPPDQPGLADQVLGSARQVGVDVNGCATRSEIQDARFERPDTPRPENAPDVVAICMYDRGEPDVPGLVGSRQLAGVDARRLWEAIETAPPGVGPNRPQNCVDDMFGEQAIVLRFLPEDWSPRDIAYPEAYVYYDWCFGNGVFDPDGEHQLTEANCEPLFAEPPVQMWSAQSNVYRLCRPGRS